MLQAGKSRVRIPVSSLNSFSGNLILSAALCSWGLLSFQAPEIFLEVIDDGAAPKVDNLTAICALIV
jgi:hypothetical protein